MVRKSKGAEGRRALAILRLAEGKPVAHVAKMVEAARSAVYRWIGWYELEGQAGLISDQGGRPHSSVTEDVVTTLSELVAKQPKELGYLRSSWTSELLAVEVNDRLGSDIHASTVRRLLPRLGFRWRRSRPTLFLKDPRKAQKMAAIEEALGTADPRTDVFYVDEVDIDLNPKTGFCWTRRGTQQAIPTPGKNRKRYMAGALHARTGKVIWVEGKSKSSDLFIDLMAAIKASYRRSRQIVLILDNYIIHKSRKTERWLSRDGEKFRLLFQPAYHPWVNRIERLWKALHDTVTRNHRYPTIDVLMEAVHSFMQAVQPFPGGGHSVARAG